MTTPPDPPGPSTGGAPSPGGARSGGNGQRRGGRSGGGAGNSGNRNGGNQGRAGTSGQKSSGQRSAGQKSSGQNRGSNARGGGQQRSSSGNRRPSGQGGRPGQGRNPPPGGGAPRQSAPPAPVVRVDRTAELAEEAAAAANRRKAALLSLVPGAIVGVVAAVVLAVVGLPVVAVLALIVVTIGVGAAIWSSAPGRVLASLGAVPSSEDDFPRLHNLVDGLCATMGLDRPSIAVVRSDVPNALALGRDPKSATLVVTSGLEQSLGLVELEGVLAHELVHIKRNDTVLAAVAVVVSRPLALFRGNAAGAEMVHGLVGRGREFSADQRAALIVRYPTGIGSALETMTAAPGSGGWPPATGRTAALTRWLWVDPMAGGSEGESSDGNLDDTRVRAAALGLG